MIEKKFWYEVDPLFFYDYNDDGFGDFKGFIKKIDYFNFLNIDTILIPDIFNQENVILKNAKISIYDKYGNIKDLKKIISLLKKYEIDLFVEIDLKNILNSMINKKTSEELKINDIDRYIEQDNSVQHRKLYWNTEKRINSFKNIINFWAKLKVNNFVFTNFEYLYEKNSRLDKKLLNQLKFLYIVTKNLNNKANIAIRSTLFSNHTINNIFSKYINVICDFYIDSSFSLISTNKNFPFDIQKKFNINNVLKKIKGLKIKSDYLTKYIISLNNNKIGRVNSRWLNEENLIDESNKCLLMFSNLLPYSTINYFGDELGQLRLKINSKNDYHDYEYNEKKRFIEFKKHKTLNYDESQKYLSRINTQSFFMWNKKMNGGFSKNKKVFRALPINYLSHNLENEYKNDKSIVHFYKNLIDNNKKIDINKIITNQKLKMKLKNKILIIKWNEVDFNKMILINLNNKAIDINISKKWNVELSTIATKKYISKIKSLSPYESLVLSKNNKN